MARCAPTCCHCLFPREAPPLLLNKDSSFSLISCHSPAQRPWLRAAFTALPIEPPDCSNFRAFVQAASPAWTALLCHLVQPTPAFSQPRPSRIFPTRLSPAPDSRKNLTSKVRAADDAACCHFTLPHTSPSAYTTHTSVLPLCESRSHPMLPIWLLKFLTICVLCKRLRRQGKWPSVWYSDTNSVLPSELCL